MTCGSITAVILCFNEERNIRHCLESVAGFCAIQVVDSYSTDNTVAICREFTEQVEQHRYDNHASQWQWALDNLHVNTEWILALDADFAVSDALKERILSDLESVPASVDGVYVRHRYRFGGNVIRFGGTKQYWLRIVRAGRARADLSDMVDFRFAVAGETLSWREHVLEYNRNDDEISTWISKQDKFSARLAVEEELRRRKLRYWEITPGLLGNPDSRFAWLRDVWLRFPLFWRPVLYFFYRYVLALGFLDGRGGFLYHSLQGFWLRLVIDWKLVQLRQAELGDEELVEFSRFVLSTREASLTALLQRWKSSGRPHQDL